jgi:peptidoglycan/LPS O-acetylase OafA/YrhL
MPGTASHFATQTVSSRQGTIPEAPGGNVIRPKNSAAGFLLGKFSRETSSGRFIPEMDGLRFVAIGMVFLFHLNAYFTTKVPAIRFASTYDSDWLAGVALVGFRGVELFFVISGFILGLPFAAHHINGSAPVNLRRYYLRRLTRLEPPYIVTVLVLFALAIWFQGETTQALYRHLAASLLYSHNLIYGTHSPVIGVAWSLEIEVQFYLLVPALTLFFAIRNHQLRRFTLVASALLVLAAQKLFLGGSPRLSLSILAYLQFFLIGFLLADMFIADWKNAPRQSFYWDAIALCGWPILFVSLRSEVLTHWLFPYLILAVYAAAFRGVLVNRFFSNPWITAIGGMCYSIYLIHYEVISAVGRLTRKIGVGFPYWSYLLVQFVLVGFSVVLVCGIYFLLLERPCMNRDWPQRFWNVSQSFFANKRARHNQHR